MAVNTAYMDDGQYTTGSSLSVVASRATVKAQDVTATGALAVTGAATLTGAVVAASTISAVGTTSVGALVANSTISAVGQISGGLAQFNSKVTFNGGPIILSSSTTNQSAATAKVLDGQLIPSILSLTTNGAALYFRSGNSTYVWPSSGVIG